MLKRTTKSARALRAGDEKLLDDAVQAAVDELDETLPAELEADDLDLEDGDLTPEEAEILGLDDEIEGGEEEIEDDDEELEDGDEEIETEDDEIEADEEDGLFEGEDDEIEAGDDCPGCEAEEELEGEDDEIEGDDEEIIPDDKPVDAVLAHRYAARQAARARRYAALSRKADINRPGVEDTIGNQMGGGTPSVSTLDDTGIPVSEAKALAARIDKIANYCQKHGQVKLAYRLDVIANTLDPQ